MNAKDNIILTENNQLCLHCGLCCMGYFHSQAIINNEEDLNIAKLMGASIIKDSDNKQYFEHPCPKFDSKCTIYPDRPSVCENHECGLFNDVKYGKIKLEKAIKITNEMKMLCKTLDEALVNLPYTGSLKTRFSTLLTSKETIITKKEYPKLMLKYAAFQLLKNKYFYHDENFYQEKYSK